MRRRLPLAVIGLVGSTALAAAQPRPADLALVNGRVLTADDHFAIHQAVVIRGDRIVAVGSNDLARQYQAARVIELRGRLVLPGFNDTHVHIAGRPRRHVDLAGAGSIDEVQRRIRAKATELGPGDWVTGSGWSEDELVERRRPLRWDLDEAAPANPVVITRAGGHSAVANSLALKLAGITRETPDPEGGLIERDARGEPNGVIRERQGIVTRLVPPATREEVRASFLEQLRSLLPLGITSFTQAGIPPDDFAEWETVYREHGATLPRATVQIRFAVPEGRGEAGVRWGGAAAMRAFGRKTGDGDARLKVGAVKLSVDGGFTGPAAYTLLPYKGQPAFRGYLNFSEAIIEDVVRTAHRLGWQMGFHAIGDAAIKLTVDLFAQALDEEPRPDHRHYLTHFTVPPPAETLQKMARYRILIAQQPNFTYTLEGRYEANLDGERLERNNPLRTPIERGIFMAFGSDNLPIGPMIGLYAAVTRKGRSGRVWGSAEAVSIRDAIRAYTRNGAFLTFDEAIKGTIEPGKLADLVVLNQDLLSLPPDRLKDVRVDLTIVGGRILYERPSGTASTGETRGSSAAAESTAAQGSNSDSCGRRPRMVSKSGAPSRRSTTSAIGLSWCST